MKTDGRATCVNRSGRRSFHRILAAAASGNNRATSSDSPSVAATSKATAQQSRGRQRRPRSHLEAAHGPRPIPPLSTTLCGQRALTIQRHIPRPSPTRASVPQGHSINPRRERLAGRRCHHQRPPPGPDRHHFPGRTSCCTRATANSDGALSCPLPVAVTDCRLQDRQTVSGRSEDDSELCPRPGHCHFGGCRNTRVCVIEVDITEPKINFHGAPVARASPPLQRELANRHALQDRHCGKVPGTPVLHRQWWFPAAAISHI